MKFGFALLAGVLGLGIAFGCSSGGSGGGSSGTTAGSNAAICTAYCDWEVRCSKGDANCQNECTSDTARNEGKWSAAYISMAERCFQGLACTEKDDACISNFGAADPAFPNIPEVQACLDRRTECSQPTPEGDSGSVTQPSTAFSDDYCLSIAALTTEARANADACRSQPCAGVRDCLIQAGAFNY